MKPHDRDTGSLPADPRLAAALSALRVRTPARLLAGRAGTSYRTATQLELREDHAAAIDAVAAEMDLVRDLGAELVARLKLFEVASGARDKREYLARPELGRRLTADAMARIRRECPHGVDLQVAIGDGLSAAAVAAQVPALLPLLESGAAARGWSFGRPFAVRYCRVGVLNDIGEALDPRVVVLLIGERPGLANSESLSAYLAYRPRPGDSDAKRNLISNIHRRGVEWQVAAERILSLAGRLQSARTSGVAIKEDLSAATPGATDSARALPANALRSLP
jgi:ethanolamine ammonia-lyase small subunit